MLSSGVSARRQRENWRTEYLVSNDQFVLQLPKIEMHVHIEGTMTAELRWKLAERNKIALTAGSEKVPITSLAMLQEEYKLIAGRIGAASADMTRHYTFFEVYYGGFDLLQTEEDYYDLAMNYFERAADMNVRYCEPFFDPQGHTRRGVPMNTIMEGFQRAQVDADMKLHVKSQWIMCILRDMSPENALQQYEAMLPYRSMIVGIGLDSDEYERPPSLFCDLFSRARADGFKLTCHCDVNQKDNLEHIQQVCNSVGSTGADRIDHGLNAAEREDLIALILQKDIGMTLCPCTYLRHESVEWVMQRFQVLFDAGIKVTINSDDPAYHEDNWILHNYLMARNKCKLTNAEIARLARNAVSICWAKNSVKEDILKEIDELEERFRES